jgi:hypothetical protein
MNLDDPGIELGGEQGQSGFLPRGHRRHHVLGFDLHVFGNCHIAVPFFGEPSHLDAVMNRELEVSGVGFEIIRQLVFRGETPAPVGLGPPAN